MSDKGEISRAWLEERQWFHFNRGNEYRDKGEHCSSECHFAAFRAYREVLIKVFGLEAVKGITVDDFSWHED